MKALAKYAKAVAAALVAGYAMYQAKSADGVTANEWVDIIVTTLAASGLTWLVPNAPAAPKPEEPTAGEG